MTYMYRWLPFVCIYRWLIYIDDCHSYTYIHRWHIYIHRYIPSHALVYIWECAWCLCMIEYTAADMHTYNPSQTLESGTNKSRGRKIMYTKFFHTLHYIRFYTCLASLHYLIVYHIILNTALSYYTLH